MTVAPPRLGVGLGFRPALRDELARDLSAVDFLEFIGDSCFEAAALDEARAFARRCPIVCHFLGLSLGSVEPLDGAYLERMAAVIQQLQPVWFSDHLAITSVEGVDIGHLSPIGFTDESVEIVIAKIRDLKARWRIPFLLENITYHFPFPGATLSEREVLARIVDGADCGILLDLNNLFVNAHNHRYDPYAFLDSLPLERVVQVHIGGATMRDGMAIDSHAHPVDDRVFDYLAYLCERATVAAVLLERDWQIPRLDELAREMARARAILHASPARRTAAAPPPSDLASPRGGER